jgi:hypothetical protein
VSRRPCRGLRLAALSVLLAAVAIIAGWGGGGGSGNTRHLASMFQDDQLLLYEPSPVVAHTLDQLRALGVDQIRVTVLWRVAAPAPDSATRPAGFVATDPAAYPPTRSRRTTASWS